MNAAVLAAIAVALFALGYRYYSSFLARHIFRLEADEPVPSVTEEDGVDFVPTPKAILWGHHYTSIAGAAPIVGPAIAVIWGWLPALVWVVLGTVFMGAVHDFSALVISLRRRGHSIGDIAGDVISPRVRRLFLVVISLLIWIVLAVFAFIIGTLFVGNPGAIFPINVQILVALLLGGLVFRRRAPALWPSIAGYVVLIAAIFLGNDFAAAFPAITRISVGDWVWLLLIYSFVASVLPVWALLQPRDYLNSHQLITGLVLLGAGLVVLHPTIQAPMINPNPAGAPPMIPFLFITIACGAISGFHGLVSSGTTSKQVACMPDARPIGYGGMLGEGTLGLLAVLAATAGFATQNEWFGHYASWGAASGLDQKLDAFVTGGAVRFVAALGVPVESGRTFIAVMVIAFAATSLDTGARIQRLIISELAADVGVPALRNRYAAGALGIGAALLLALTQAGGKGGLVLWPLFGTTNQLVAGVTLLVVSIWLQRLGRPVVYTLVPMVLVGAATVTAMLQEVTDYYRNFGEQGLLAVLGSVILAFDVWIIAEGLHMLFSEREPAPEAKHVKVDDLDGRAVMITGAGSGIGRALALLCARRGADLHLCDLDVDGLDATAAAARELGSDVHAVRVDVADREAMRDFAAAVHEHVDAVDLLVNNAGVGLGGGFLHTTLEDWDWIVDINLKGVVHGCHFFVPAMVARGRGGHVVNLSSLAGFVAPESLCAYSTTKFAVRGLSEALRDELTRHGIGVTAVCPGIIDTPITESSRLRGEEMQHPEVRAEMIAAYRRRGYGPDRVAANILKAVGRNRAIAPVSPEAWVGHWLQRFTPGLVRWFNQRLGERSRRRFSSLR